MNDGSVRVDAKSKGFRGGFFGCLGVGAAIVIVIVGLVVIGTLARGGGTEPAITSPDVAVADTVTDTIPPDTAAGPEGSFGEGVYRVGTDIQPGLYRSSGGGYWARLRSSDTSDVIANDFKDSGFMYCRVRSTDAYVEFRGEFVRVGK